MNRFVRQDLKNYKPYHAPIKPYEIKVDANEMPFPHQKELALHMATWMEEKDNLTRYPDTDSNLLREKIAQINHVAKENVLCGVGSDQIIELIIKVFVEPGDSVVVPTPSFSMYQLSTLMNRGKVVEVPLDHEFNYDIEAMIQVIIEVKPKLIFLCTPNNPTGCLLTREEIIRVLEVADCPVIVDEAYAEFTQDTMIEELKDYPDMILLRTFSKSYGLAGLRTGYAIAQSDMIETINLVKPPYNLSSYSQEASIFVLNHKEYYDQRVIESIQQREWLKKELGTINYIEKIYESHANFILVRLKEEAIIQLLDQQKILVRDYPPVGALAHCIRITVGTAEENKRIIEVLKEAMHE